jgi:hypothetical protein
MRLIRIVPPEYASAGYAEMVIRVLLPSLIGRSKRERLFGLLGLPVAARIGPVGFKIIDTINATVF